MPPFVIGFLVAVEAALAYALIAGAAVHVRNHRVVLALAFLGGITTGIIVAGVPGSATALYSAHFLARIRFVLALMLILMAFAAAHRTTVLDGGQAGGASPGRAHRLAMYIVAFVWLIPESAYLAERLADLAALNANPARTMQLGILGIVAAAGVGVVAEFAAKRIRVGRYLTLSTLYCALFALKFAGPAGATVAVIPLAEMTIRVVSEMFHDTFHLIFNVLQMPDHPFLRTYFYQGILVFLSPWLHAAASATLLASPAIFAGALFVGRGQPRAAEDSSAPQRRLATARFRATTVRVAVTAILLTLVVSTVIVREQIGMVEPYDPLPLPVIDDGAGSVVVPLPPKPGSEVGVVLTKYNYARRSSIVTFMVVQKPDGSVVVALDQCVVCHPMGYALLNRDHVLCKYCNTPIPVQDVGRAGGCHQIPVKNYVLKGTTLLIPIRELMGEDSR